MKKIICLLLFLFLFLSLTGCLSQEEKEQKLEYEKRAQEVLTNYFEENYDNYKILSIEHTVIEHEFSSDLGENTKITVKIDNEKYVFYFNQKTEEVFSNINLDKIKTELLERFCNENFPQNFNKKEISVRSLDYEFDEDVLNLRDDTLEKVLYRISQDNDYYGVVGNFYYIDRNLDYKNFKINNFIYDFKNVNINFFNVKKDYINNPYSFNITQRLNFSYSPRYDKHINLNIEENKTIKKDDIYFVYTPKYFDIEINKIETKPEILIDEFYEREYKNDGIWYSIVSKKLYSEYPSSTIEGDLEIRFSVSSGVEIFVPRSKYLKKGIYNDNNNSVDILYDEKENYIREFIFCDKQETVITDITFVKSVKDDDA